jgi:tripartite-type tricarboxylate transporter receptor subunit TctC
MKSKILLSLTAVFTATLFLTQAYGADCNWKPTRAVTYIVPWGAGGGTDANSRMLSSLLSKNFGVPFNVVNKTGGNGVTGHSALAKAKPDGYTIGSATVEIATMHWVGLTDLSYKNITPIALVDIVPAGVTVKKGSQFKSLGELLAYAKANPGKLTGSGTSQGGIWHLALAGMLQSEGMPADAIRWIPSKGAGPAMKEIMAGGVDVVTVALSEAKALIEQGELTGLAYMNPKRMSALPDVPTTVEELPNGWTLAAYITVSGPEGLPENIACSYDAAAKEAFATKEWADFKASRGSDVVYMGSKDLTAMIAKSDTDLGETIKAIGLAK